MIVIILMMISRIQHQDYFVMALVEITITVISKLKLAMATTGLHVYKNLPVNLKEI